MAVPANRCRGLRVLSNTPGRGKRGRHAGRLPGCRAQAGTSGYQAGGGAHWSPQLHTIAAHQLDGRPVVDRRPAAALLGCALLCTLAFHYLIDMVVALPFTVAMFALTQRHRIGSDWIRRETILWSLSLALSVGLHLRAVREAQTTRLHSKNFHSSTPLRSTRNAERTTHPTRCFIESARPMKAGNTTRT